jgi:putative ABC transport system substrate-binding protein
MNLNKKISFRWQILFLTLLVAICTLLSGCGKKTEKVYRVGVLWTGGKFLGDILDAFKEKMTELGYIEGRNIVYDVYMAPLPVRNEQIVQKYVDGKVDLIFSFATEATIEAKAVAEGSGIPIVFSCTFIEGTGVVESVGNPGGNITGVRYPTTESATGRLEYLHEIAPQAKRIWVTYLKDYPTTSAQIEAIQPVALELDLTLIEKPFATPQEVKAYLDEHAASSDIRMDAILLLAEPFSVTPEVTNAVYKFADEHKLPISSFMVLNEAYGPIIGFHPANTKMGSLAAIQADKILQGTPAGTLPVITADNDLRINYKVIKELGLDVPEGLLGRADEIVH